jgi:hypothetical protein
MTITPTAPTDSELAYQPLTDEERKQFHEQGYLHLPGVLSEDHVARLQAEADRLYEENRGTEHIDKTGSLHLLGAVRHSPEFAKMLDHAATFRHVWGNLGWNIYSQHNHLDVNPPYEEDETPRWEWHQDGWRQNSDAEYYAPLYGDIVRPMLSLKLGYVLSDISEPGRGQTQMIPGSHLNNHMYRPTDPEEIAKGAPGAVPWLAKPGDAFLFDRRLWHSRSRNRSNVTRKMLFMSYTYRWIRPVDDMPIDRDSEWYANLTPVQRQLIGDAFGELKVQNMWGVGDGGWVDDTIPLRAELKARGLLDRNIPWLR